VILTALDLGSHPVPPWWDRTESQRGSNLLRRQLRLHPSSIGAARRLVRHTLAEAGREDLAETAQLLVSELITNALLHAGTHVELSLSVADGGVVVLVSDGSAHPPVMSHPEGPTDEGGRGLVLVEQLSHAWGVLPSPRGKAVWFQLDSTPAVPAGDVADSAGSGTTCTIEFVDAAGTLPQGVAR
jgi:anti-sigma regulatory factor (Ser/Thr protein kinase)